ncbi:hypothetical protein [Myxococcus sp. AM010]|uniref:hypothetical protein n=1 Tax=Myxococcus sp. AM010 TaxID=2745138 RepID=UPI0015951855|nr:hypothetical protein [Myxococcus sp. AM010]NVJ13120.1 hypothetical protein [Myxococcus sp. AM010]
MREAENIWRGGTSDRVRAVTRSTNGRFRQRLDIIIRRYRGSLLGRMYQVRHATSGEPSLDLELTERQQQFHPDVGLELHISAHPASTLAPPRVRLRVHAPDGASDADVARNLEGTLATAKAMVQTACTRSALADTMAHLRSPPRRRGPVLRSRRWLRRVRRAARRTWRSAGSATTVALALVAAALVGVYMVPPPPSQPPQTERSDWSGGKPPGWMVPVSTLDTLVLARDMPPRPFEGQKTKKCDPDQAEVSINGGCWVATDRTAPCGDKMYEHKGKCYRPVGKPNEPLRSISR